MTDYNRNTPSVPGNGADLAALRVQLGRDGRPGEPAPRWHRRVHRSAAVRVSLERIRQLGPHGLRVARPAADRTTGVTSLARSGVQRGRTSRRRRRRARRPARQGRRHGRARARRSTRSIRTSSSRSTSRRSLGYDHRFMQRRDRHDRRPVHALDEQRRSIRTWRSPARRARRTRTVACSTAR